eukprot:CAMPEP_0170596262 /NCGR_PEP_ID=MMETSP0224-20130122/15015_1 /TAXON_ID=285029 /ORGANISM="Togula jolla, Strain CCCM 725" /LENGTH=59 /DNA_ID=CAMNT_0010920525 /DNA_START=450 /DNA_END=625 /DNA_ORIENTATION=-
MTTACMSIRDYNEATQSVKDLLSSLPQTCDTEECPVADLAGCIVRMAGHDFMDFRDGQG